MDYLQRRLLSEKIAVLQFFFSNMFSSRGLVFQFLVFFILKLAFLAFVVVSEQKVNKNYYLVLVRRGANENVSITE